MRVLVGASLVFFSLIGTASAGTITAVGAVKPLTNINQMLGVVGSANFDEGPTSGPIPLNQYTPQGLTWRTGTLSSILPGVTNTGSVGQPSYWSSNNWPLPIGGGGVHNGQGCFDCGVATFNAGLTITQVGLTASNNGTQYLTAWNMSGQMLGQVTWTPAGDAAFVGIDTMGVPIGMVAYGNHDVWSGVPYADDGASIIDESWIWAVGKCTSSSQCDDGNPCTDDTCNASSQCVHTNNTAACNDGNACTANDVCSGGTCKPGTPVTCTALDSCHMAGTCDPTTGCSNPVKSNGSSCDDKNACTANDTCTNGTCAGKAITCTALDQCHTVGVCNPATGTCSNPNKADGSACSDKNACTQTDTCQNGACTGMSPITCAAPSQCQNAGSCDQTTGMCAYTDKPDGTACDDSNPCTQMDTCQAGQCVGGSPVVCAALDACHDVGVCDTTTGACTSPNKADGTMCDDGSACTSGDTCMAGTCTGALTVTCAPADACHVAGTCDHATGTCSTPTAPDGTECPGGACMGGTCVAGGTGGSTTTTTSMGGSGTGGSASMGGSGTGATSASSSGGCKCGVADSATSGTPAAALLMLLALRRRRRAAAAAR